MRFRFASSRLVLFEFGSFQRLIEVPVFPKKSHLCFMKRLVLVRHAKSSWDHPGLRDFERPLGPRGKRDAPQMADLAAEKGLQPDKIVSSPAKRAHDTALYFATAYAIDPSELILVEDIYEALPDVLEKVIADLDDHWDTVFLFGHNPGFTLFANRYTQAFRFDNVPTCGIVVIESEQSAWAAFVPGQANVSKWYFPKECIY
jgi:phosphohistidine phosphatase